MASHSLMIVARNRKITTDANVNYCLVTPITLTFVIELFVTRKEGFPDQTHQYEQFILLEKIRYVA
jgi:hypothetical protein